MEPSRARILEAATREFADKGVAGVRIDEIATRSRANKQLIYHYFGSKADLFEAALVAILERTDTTWRTRPRRTFRERMRQVAIAQQRPGVRRWRRMMGWEAIEFRGEHIPHQAQREALWALRSQSTREAQSDGQLDGRLDAQMVTLMELALTGAPHAHPQITKLITGHHPDDAAFAARQLAFVDALVDHLEQAGVPVAAPIGPAPARARRVDGAAAEDPTRRRERILEAATDEFADKGVAGVRVDAVAARAGANKQLIYHYFGSKAKLFDAALARLIATTDEAWAQVVPTSYRERARDLVVAQERDSLWRWRRMMGWEAIAFRGRTIPDEAQRAAAWARRSDGVRRAQAAGELDPALDTEMLTLFVFSVVTTPHTLPQLTRVMTGVLPTDPAFAARQLAFVDRLVTLLAPRATGGAART